MKTSVVKRPGSRARSGFSLVEMLIVVVVIGILAGILLPVFHNARGRANTAVCAGNLRQIGLALESYARDHNGYYPPNYYGSLDCCWADAIAVNYARSVATFHCPTYELGEYRPGCAPPESIDGVNHPYDGSYNMNNPPNPLSQVLRQTHWRHPSTTFFVLDGKGSVNIIGATSLKDEEELRTSTIDPRHNSGANVLFGDGHVKRVDIPTLLQRKYWILPDES